MSVDLSQFHQVFLEESFEGLDLMEGALMELDPDNIEDETINAIFRAAHSIKGGSATFGFSAIAEFTHVLETLLDQVRGGERSITSIEVDLFLQSVDAMREMLAIVQQGDNHPTEKSQKLQNQFNQILAGGKPNEGEVISPDKTQLKSSVVGEQSGGWVITFSPHQNLLMTGNDPARILRALSDLGDATVIVDAGNVPELSQLDPENIHLSWRIELVGTISEADIEEVFEWVSEEADIEWSPLFGQLSSEPQEAAPANVVGVQWHIHFVPNEEVLKAGNDIVKMFQALRSCVDTYTVQVHVNRLPSLKLLDPENCHLSWDLVVSGDLSLEDIRDVFEWVMDDSVVHIERIEPRKSDAVTAAGSATEGSMTKAATVAPARKPLPNKKANQQETSSIRVGIDKIDNLINMVGELVITQSMLGQLGTDFDATKTPKLLEGLSQLEQNTRELQESVMRIRMLPISFAFSRFPRMVRDVSQQLNKKIHLEMNGEHTELDKTVMEKIGDPLVHLVRNAIDHGIELPEERVAAGKPAQGNVILNAYHQGGNVVIEISDDGKGLDREKLIAKALEKNILQETDAALLTDEQAFELIFHPGFSTASAVSDLSGRGVGMDVVRKNIQALNGIVEIHSKPGEGSSIRIRLPLTLAILDGQLVRVGDNTYIFPLVSIVESIQCNKDHVNHIAGGCSVFRLRDDYVPIVRLDQVFSVRAEHEDIENALMVVVEADGEKVGVVVDELLAQQQVVIKSLEHNYRRIDGVSGATILGDGTVALIVDIPGVVKLAGADNYSINAQKVILQNQSGQAAEVSRQIV